MPLSLGLAAIDREAGGPLGPGESARAAPFESGTRDLLDLVGQLAGVAVDPLLLLGRDRLAEDQGEDARQGRGHSGCATS